MIKKNEKKLTDREKQFTPLPGEVSPKDAFKKATQFAAIEKVRLKRSKKIS